MILVKLHDHKMNQSGFLDGFLIAVFCIALIDIIF